ncbi:MAG: SBBP repeat-containing protein [Saprospirales bacterium]|nr:SBBP repeat-containing protein [Saprospirales bacterium]
MKYCILFALFGIGIKGFSQSFEWAKGIGGDSDDSGESIAVDASGNVYTTGAFQGVADFDPGPGIFNLTSAGAYDMFISKLDAAGNFIWAKHLGAVLDDKGRSIAVDATGNVYVTGEFRSAVDFDPGPGFAFLFAGTESDAFVLKLDEAGTFVWAASIGADSGDSGRSISIDATNHIYIAGAFGGNVDFDPGQNMFLLSSAGSTDIFISKMDSNGGFLWAKRMGGVSGDECNAVSTDPGGNVYITGDFLGTADFDPGQNEYNLTSAGISDAFICKLDPDGDFAWARQLSGNSNALDVGLSIDVDDVGNIYTTGFFNFDLLAFSSAIFISKLDATGNLLWLKQMDNSGAGQAITIDAGKNVYTIGEFQGTVDFDPGPGTFNLTSSGGNDVFICKLDAAGNFVWAKQMGGSSSDSGYAILVDDAGAIYTSGRFRSTSDFDPSSGMFNLTSSGSWDIFILKMNQQNTDVANNNSGAGFATIYPNPTTGKFLIDLHGNDANIASIEIINARGQTLVNVVPQFPATPAVDLAKAPSGVYFVRLHTTGRSYFTLKVLKERGSF